MSEHEPGIHPNIILQLSGFLESHYLDKHVTAFKQLGDQITNLKCLGAAQKGMREYLFDKHALGKSS